MDYKFPKILKELRQEAHLSAKQLGEQLQVSDSTIIRWENSDRVPTIINLYNIALFFKVSADYLIGLED